MPEALRILGLDPGSRITGYGVIDIRGNHTRYVASGCIRTASKSFPERLHHIFTNVATLVKQYAPGEVAVERVFMARNADSALKLGQARGAAICGAFCADPITMHEYSASEIKQAVVGRGRADKRQVQHMVGVLLSVAKDLQADAADALAVALCHAHMRTTMKAIQQQLARNAVPGT